MPVTILILAAGASSRMRGADKLLEEVEGEAQLVRIAKAALATGAPVLVALPTDRPARAAALGALAVTPLIVADATEGMAASIRAGAATVAGGGLMILPADMPELDSGDLTVLLRAAEAAPDRIWRATSARGVPGHPVIFPADLLAELAAVTGDEGARAVLRRHTSRLCPLPLADNRAITDLDTPEDWATWRAERKKGP